jgi:hypothetical protein
MEVGKVSRMLRELDGEQLNSKLLADKFSMSKTAALMAPPLCIGSLGFCR